MFRGPMSLTLAVLAFFATAAHAAPVTKTLAYKIGESEFSSTLVYDDTSGKPRPGLVLVPNWYGAGEAAVNKAKAIAGSDYVILVADVFGKDVRPKNDEEALAAVKGMYADRNVLRARVTKALDTLKAQAGSAPLQADKLGAIGFCFGGATALELARSGADIDGVVTFHGALNTSLPAAPGAVKASLLVINGADDSYVPATDIAALQKELTDAKADWQFVNLSGAVHCFAEPDASSPPGCLYNERAAKRSFNMMRDFFAERFAAP